MASRSLFVWGRHLTRGNRMKLLNLLGVGEERWNCSSGLKRREQIAQHHTFGINRTTQLYDFFFSSGGRRSTRGMIGTAEGAAAAIGRGAAGPRDRADEGPAADLGLDFTPRTGCQQNPYN